jgi:hypothetical protein
VKESPLLLQLLLMCMLDGVQDNALGRVCLGQIEQKHKEKGQEWLASSFVKNLLN